MSEREVQDIKQDIEGEINQLIEDISKGLTFDDEETKMDLLGVETEPPPRKETGQHRWLLCNDA